MSSPRTAKVYQIDFTAVQTGKHIASTKRRVRWRFGFANLQALARGETGTACRGSEHEVTFVWSITSGKCLVLADGQEVHYSTSRSSIFDFSWTMKGNHILKIVAHAAPPLSQTPNFRQYDFFVDGQSFFTFPKVFRLGLAPGQAPPVSSPGSAAEMAERGERRRRGVSSENITNLEAPNNPDEEEAYLQEAIRQSLQDGKPPGKARGSTASASEMDLLDFGSAPLALPPSSDSNALQSSVLTSFVSQPYSYGGVSGAPASSAADPFGYNPQHSVSTSSMPALPPSTNYSAPPATGVPTDPWAATSVASLPPTTTTTTTMNGYGSSTTNTYPPSTSLVPSSQQQQQSSWALPSQPPPFTAPAPSPAATASASAWPPPSSAPNPPPPQQAATSSSWTPPAPIQTQYGASANPFGGVPANPDSSPFGSAVPPTVTPQAQQTPSTIGFMSPAPTDYPGFASPAGPSPFQSDPLGQAAPSSTPADPALFSMSTLTSFDAPAPAPSDAELNGTANATNNSSSLVDQTYSKLVNMDTFSLVSKNDAPRSNPFESSTMNSTIGGSQSLADMKAKKASSGPAKPVMNTPMPAPGAMVVSSNQNGSYGASYGMQQPSPFGASNFGQPTQPVYGQAPAPPASMMASYSYSQPPQPAFGAPPPQPSFGAPQSQPSYGAPQPPSTQQQQPMYGQPPAAAPSLFGQPPLQPYGASPPPAPAPFAQPSFAYGAPNTGQGYY